jgi:dTDP-4-dehydrorhamnose reductase
LSAELFGLGAAIFPLCRVLAGMNSEAIFARVRPPAPRLIAIESQDYPTQAARPRNSPLDCSRIRRISYLEQPDWRISHRGVLSELGKAEAQ